MAGVKSEKPKYVAKVGLDFEGDREHVRVEAGEAIPITLSDKEAKQLLANGDIEEVK